MGAEDDLIRFCLVLLNLCPAVVLAAPARVVYTDSLAAGWENWSWSTNANFAATSPVRSGTRSIGVTYTAGWGALRLQTWSYLNTADYTTLRFSIHGGTAGGQSIRVFCYTPSGGGSAATVLTPPAAGSWRDVEIPLSTFNVSQIAGVVWQCNSSSVQTPYYLDAIDFVPVPTLPPPPPALSVDAAAGRYPISPLIYGMNWADPALASELKLTVNRWGGNMTTRYNWMADAFNHASDWYFMSIPADNPNPQLLPDGSSSDRFVEDNLSVGMESYMCVPMIGWVAKDRVWRWSYSVSKYGAQQQTEPWHPDAGNGIQTDGTRITWNDPNDANIPVGPAFVQAWIQHLVGKYGSAANGGVKFYNYDNEPNFYDSVHRDVHPQALTAAELLSLCTSYGAAVRAADPAAVMAGPTVGWNDLAAGQQLPGVSGDPPLTAWFLDRMRQHEQTTGQGLLDYLDAHYYPGGAGLAFGGVGDESMQELRLRSTRALWDPTYVEESWINKAVWLIPRLRQWIDQYYPGRKVSLGEYQFGGGEHINGALAQADVLGILARERVDLAALWGELSSSQPQAHAFRMFRNYDGLGGEFGILYVGSTSSDQGVVSIYGSIQGDSSLAVMLVNKVGFNLTCNLTLQNFAHRGSARVYRYSGADLTRIVHEPDLVVSGGLLPVTLPAASITLLVLPADLAGDFDDDGLVNAADVALFIDCASGPSIPLTDPARCDQADFDRDHDVDQDDFGALQRCLTAPGVPQDPECVGLSDT